MASKCRKFVPNMFNKTKCQACFGSKEAHSAAALENNKAIRKVSKCGYLFIAPDFDFSNPLDRTRRWQRRFFRLFDDGELTFSVDDHMDTVPQGSVDMNKCTDILEAEVITSHCHSLAVVTPDKTEYIKADSKEEIQWWHDVLVKFPNNLKALKTRRKPNYVINSNKENVKPTQNEENAKKPPPSPVKSDGPSSEKTTRSAPGTDSADYPYPTFKGVRSLKHKADRDHQEGLRKSSSLHDLTAEDKVTATSLTTSRFLSCSGDRLDSLDSETGRGTKPREGGVSTETQLRPPRNSCPSSLPSSTYVAPTSPTSLFNTSSSSSSATSSGNSVNRSVEERASSSLTRPKSREVVQQSSRDVAGVPEVSGVPGVKDFPAASVPWSPGSAESGERRVGGSSSGGGGSALIRQDAEELSQQSMSADETDSNETDELKDLVYMKKGWLIKLTSSDREARKQWFVLAGNALCYYKDAKAEESNTLDGRIDLSTCYEVSEVTLPRNYGIKIKTGNGEYTLTAMTAGIRSNWIKALQLCMDIHSPTPRMPGLAASLSGKTLASLAPRAESFDTAAGSLSLGATSPVGTGGGGIGEAGFQLVGRRDPVKKESQGLRRHHSDATLGAGSKLFSVAEPLGQDSGDGGSSAGASGIAGDEPRSPTQPPLHSDHESDNKPDTPTKTPKTQRYSSSSTESLPWASPGGIPLKRFVEGSDSVEAPPVPQPTGENRRSKRSIGGESVTEEEKHETSLLAKSPCSRAKEKSRVAKAPRLHSAADDEDFECHRSLGSGQGSSSQALTDDENDLNITISSEENYVSCGDVDNPEDGHSDSLGEGSMMVEILESEVESLKERLDQTQSELVKMHETNIDLKTRLQKEASQVADSSYSSGHSGRWSQPSPSQSDTSQTQKRQLKEARETVQKQRIEIESLKSKLDMSVSKLTGTEKALSEALREYKQEKDKFLKMSSEWNRRIRTLEGQVKDSAHKQERIRETLLNKERECRRLDTEAKQHQQKLREQDREILKLKAVEQEYNQLKEQLDNRDRDLHHVHAQLHDKDSMLHKVRADFEQQVRELESEFSQERDHLESHLEELKKRLHAAEHHHHNLEGNFTSNLADLLKEKDDIIAQLEEKLIEHDGKMVDMQEELQAEMGENSDLAHQLEVMEEEKHKLQGQMMSIETQVLALKSQIVELEEDNTSLKQNLDKAHQDNAQLSSHVTDTSKCDPEKVELEKTIHDLNKQIQGLQLKLMERLGDLDDPPAGPQQDTVRSILIVESDLKEISHLLGQLQSRFQTYVSSLEDEAKQEVCPLAQMVNEIQQKCADLHESVQLGSSSMLPASCGSDYHHDITVGASSSTSAILEEYQSLKQKFDRVVVEVKKLKKEVSDVHSSCDDLQKKEQQLQETIKVMEKSYSEKMQSLGQRVDSLTEQMAAQHTQPTTKSPHTASTDPAANIDQMLKELEDRIQAMEQTLLQTADPVTTDIDTSAGGTLPESPVVQSRLQEMNHQLDTITKDLKDVLKDLPETNDRQDLLSRLDECGGKLGHLAHGSQEKVTASGRKSAGKERNAESSSRHVSSASSMGWCFQNIMDKLQEIGEQLDCLEDQNDDSDEDDDEGEAASIEEVREHLAGLCEFVKQHTTFSDKDWRLSQLVLAQKAAISKDRMQTGEFHSSHSMNKLQAYADRLSLEALILVEMAHLLERKNAEEAQDPILQEISMLNSKVLSLHQKLDQEMRTMNVTEARVDVLRVQADIMAEKIMVEGHLCSAAISATQRPSQESTEEDTSDTVDTKLLASEAILRSQLDSYLGRNLDPSCEEVWSSATHLTTRSLVQGELTFALNCLKQHLTDSAHTPRPASSVRDLYLQRLKDRHKAVMEVAELYQRKMIQAFAVIIFRDSEDLTIMDGSDSVLDTVCAEISSVIEQHIQRCKIRMRTAQHTVTAHRWDMAVNQLREDREQVLGGIRRQHADCAQGGHSQRKVDIPTQSLDNSITGFGEIVSLCAIMSAHLRFLQEQLQSGDSGLLHSEVEEEEEEEDEDQQVLQDRLCSFVHQLAEGLQEQAHSRQTQVQHMITDKDITAASIPNIPHPKSASAYSDTLLREAVFAAQTTFIMYKLKLLHEQEMEALKVAHPARRYKPRQTLTDSQDFSRDLTQKLVPVMEMMEAKHHDEMGTLRLVGIEVDRLRGVVGAHDWQQVEEQVQLLERKVGEEMKLAEERHQVHAGVLTEEQKKVEQLLEEYQQERNHFEERCATLEVELHSISHEHDDEVERMRQDVMTAVSAIRANEGQTDTQLSDKVQLLTQQMSLQKDMYMRFLEHLRGQVCGSDTGVLVDLLDRQLKDIEGSAQLMEAESVSPVAIHSAPASPHADDKGKNMEEELELLKKEKDEALAEETRNTKAALDAMRKAYEEELQQERAKYRECLLTMYNEDFVNEMRHRHRAELEKTRGELREVKTQYLSRCEDLKAAEVKVAQTKQDYETHINQLVMSSAQLDEMVNQQMDRLKDSMKKRTSSSTSTMEEELYDAQINIRVKDTELQKLRLQVKNFESSLHHTTEEHRQTMTQYLQALKENQELRKEYHEETTALQEQLDRALSEIGLKKPVKRVPSFQQRTRSPSPAGVASRRRDCASTSSEHPSHESIERKSTDLKDLRRSKSSPSLPLIFNAKGVIATMKLPSKRDRRFSQKI